MNEYQELVMNSIPDTTIDGQDGYRYLIEHYPTLLELKEMTRGEREALCDSDSKMSAFFAAVQLGQLMARAHPKIEGRAFSSIELGQAMIERFSGIEQENVCVAFTNVHNEIIKFKTMFIGGPSECVLYPDQIFKEALRCSATGLIMIHNHPTGDVEPSEYDLMFAERLDHGGQILGIQVLDFMVIGRDQYYSWREEEE